MQHSGLKRLFSAILAICMLFALPLGASASTSEAELINGQELAPVEPQSDALRLYLDGLMPELIGEADELDTYNQLKACYDYVSQNVTYGSHTAKLGTAIGDTTCRQIYRNYGEVEGYGAVALTAKVGMCNAYASAFILMAREIGLDAYLVEGQTRDGRGGYAYHKWAEIEMDGVVYVFDPQLEGSLVRAGLPAYTVFCKTYDQIPGRYIKY